MKQAPDEAVVSLGVQTHASSAEEAMRENASEMNAELEAARALGIPADDLATAWINVWPRHSDDGLHVIGYTAENPVHVTVREMARVGRVVDRAVGAGANLAGGVTFRVSDESRGQEQALAEAMADARARAEALVRAAGAQLGQVVSVEEISSDLPPPVFGEERAVAAQAGTPVEPPTLEIRVTVRVVWLIV